MAGRERGKPLHSCFERRRGLWQAERGENPSAHVSSNRGGGGRQREEQTPPLALRATEGIVAGRERGKPLCSHFERRRGLWQAERWAVERGANPSAHVSSDRGDCGRQREGETPLLAFQATEGVVAGREMGGREGGKPLRSRFERQRGLWQAERGGNPPLALRAMEGMVAGRERGKPLCSHFERRRGWWQAERGVGGRQWVVGDVAMCHLMAVHM